MMNFRTIKNNIMTILNAGANNEFVVIGYKKQKSAVETVKDKDRRVQVRYKEGEFPKSHGRTIGSRVHEINFEILLYASSAVKVDLSVLDNPASSAAQKKTALDGLLEAGELVEQSIDELFELVFNILSDASNYELGTTDDSVSNTWTTSFTKQDPVKQGSFMFLTGSIIFSCRTTETITGVTPVPLDTIETDLKLNGPQDTVALSGVLNDNSSE